MKRFVWNEESELTAADLKQFANSRSAVMLYYCNGFNMARIAIGDTDPKKDWYIPLVEAQMTWEEDTYREQLGMKRLVPGILHGLPYSSMMNYTLAGEVNPFFKFREEFPNLYLAGEGPMPDQVVHTDE
ncbi:MAG: hypothetical protein J0I47_06145 [Sphingomonas sp.]|uniref:hypothetical protein n=1 Tax=Sphingomonas sp. TaxID=28214 RepID=UPI001ACAEACF|nr:hypothetical protein [Sphingomonas sp.]MBN8807800.1 hypothetical protein [Sphingomonas sp.]